LRHATMECASYFEALLFIVCFCHNEYLKWLQNKHLCKIYWKTDFMCWVGRLRNFSSSFWLFGYNSMTTPILTITRLMTSLTGISIYCFPKHIIFFPFVAQTPSNIVRISYVHKSAMKNKKNTFKSQLSLPYVYLSLLGI